MVRLNGRGESTIHPQFTEFLEHARRLYPESRIRLFTNMNYRNGAITEALAACRCETMISLDSVRKEHLEHIRTGTDFETVIANIEKLCGRSELTAIVFTLQPDNFFEIPEVARFAAEHRCHFFCNAVRNVLMEEKFSEMVNSNVGYLKEVYAETDRLFKGTNLTFHLPAQIAGVPIGTDVAHKTCADYDRCPNAGRDICIAFDGTVTPCGMFNPYVLGDLRKQPLHEIMDGAALSEFIRYQSADPYCKNCQYVYG